MLKIDREEYSELAISSKNGGKLVTFEKYREDRMLIYGGAASSFSRCSMICSYHRVVVRVKGNTDSNISQKTTAYYEPRTSSRVVTIGLVATAAAASVLLSVVGANAVEIQSQQEAETLSNIPQTLSGECILAKDCKKARIQKPKSRQAESCTIKCVTTCIRGGDGSPGEGPLNVRKPLVVFRQGFRSRQYCLVECSDICNLIKDGEDGF